MQTDTLVAGIGAAAFAAIFVTTFYFVKALTSKKRINKDSVYVKKNKRWHFYNDFFLTRTKFHKLYAQVSNLSVYSLMEARMVSVDFFERTMLMSLLLFVVGFIGFQDILSGIIMFLISRVYMDITIYANIDKISVQMEAQLIQALTALSKAYTRHNNIPDALHDAQVGSLVRRPFNELYEIVTSTHGKKLLNEFYVKMPNRTLRTLATACWVLNDIGDAEVFVNTKSINAVSLTIQMLKSDLTVERNNHLKQQLLFKSLPRLALYPVALYPILSRVLISIFPAIGVIYNGTTGYVCKICTLIVSFACYYILSTLSTTSVARVDDRVHVIREMMKSEKVQRFAEYLQTSNLRRRRQLQDKIDHSLSSKTLPYLYLERFLFAVVVFVASVVASIVIMTTSKTVIYDNIQPVSLTSSTKYTADEAARIREVDAMVLEAEACPDKDTLYKMVRKALPRLSAAGLEEQVTRLEDKYRQYHNMQFHWWFAFIYICAASIAYNVPQFLLRLRSKVITSEAQLDVLQLQTVVAILSTTPLDTMDVIYWMSKSADVHKDVLVECYHSYAMDGTEAIYKLRKSSAVPEFSAMCDDLLTTVYQVSLSDAFSNLVTDRESSLEERKTVEEYVLSSKRRTASPIAMAPVYVFIILGIIVPLSVFTLSSAASIMQDLNI